MVSLIRKLLSIGLLVLLGGSVCAESFSGKIAPTFPQSELGAEPPVTVKKGAPNVLVWLIDDLGFGQLGSYGGPIETPNIDRLAEQGLRFSNYHTTPICSSSRVALLTGRNSHPMHIGGHSAMAINFPGQDARVPRAAGTIANNFGQAGYLTYAIGKWDHLPPEDASQAGPFTYWPSGQGFDRFYGFLSFDTDNFSPVLWSDHQPVRSDSDADYHLSADMADRAIAWINARDSVNAERPFMLYWATGAVHAPHHAPQEYLDRYKGKFDAGWDAIRRQVLQRQKTLGLVPETTELPPRPKDMAAWDALTADQQRMYARAMEAFAAQLTHADEQFGRILQALEARGELDNTIIIVTSDNGASAEGAVDGMYNEQMIANGMFPDNAENLQYYDAWGGPQTYPLYPFGWAVAGNTPFRYYKQTAYEGGVRVPFIIHWPQGITKGGEIRRQFHHVIDIVPTLLELAGVEPAAEVNNEKQMPFDGKSMAGSIADAAAVTPHTAQYFEMYGNRAIWQEGWKAVAPHRLRTWAFIKSNNVMVPPISEDTWELYHVAEDVNELHNLAERYAEKLQQLRQTFDREARKYNVYPLTNLGEAQRVRVAKSAAVLHARQGRWRYSAPVSHIPEVNAPPIHRYSFDIHADLRLPEASNGVVLARAGFTGGIALYLLNGVPHFVLRNIDGSSLRLTADRALPPGDVKLEVNFRREQPGASALLKVNGETVASGRSHSPLPIWILSNSDPFDIGSDSGSAASSDYQPPFVFDGDIREVMVNIVE